MAFFPSASKSLPFALMLALAACGSEDDKPAGETDETDEVDAEDADEGDTTGRLDAGGKLDAGKPPTGDKKDASSSDPVKSDASTPAKSDASTPVVDSGTKDAAVADSGTKDSGTPDAGKPSTGDAGGAANGACNDKTPHGCFTPAPGNVKGCPATSPEIPFLLPGIDQWDLCNGAAVGAGATCTWNGPDGATANCICDTGAHWICVYL